MEGNTITIIEPVRGVIAGQKKIYKLWIQGGIITVSKEKDVKAIDNVLIAAKKLKVNAKEYLHHMICTEGLFER